MMITMDQRGIDEAIQAYYGGSFDEGTRLTTRSAQGRLEFERTQELAEREDRLQALFETRRVCRPGGMVHAAAIPRLGAFAPAVLDPSLLDSSIDAWLGTLREGTPLPSLRFPGGHFHTPAELEEEMLAAGLRDVSVIGLEGPAGFALESVPDVSEDDYAAAIQLARTFASTPDIRDFSNHLLATGTA